MLEFKDMLLSLRDPWDSLRKSADTCTSNIIKVGQPPWPQNYRVVQLEGVYEARQVRLPEDFRASQKLKHVIEDIIQNAS